MDHNPNPHQPIATTPGPLRLVAGPAVANLRVRPARPADRPALDAMIDRSSADTLYRRFHGPFGATTRRELRRITHPTVDHRSWVAVATGGVRGTATLAVGDDGVAELAFLVEDDWQRHGVGRALATAAMDEAARMGLRSVVAYVQPENWRAREFFHGVAPHAESQFVDREVVVRLPVASTAAPAADTATPAASTA